MKCEYDWIFIIKCLMSLNALGAAAYADVAGMQRCYLSQVIRRRELSSSLFSLSESLFLRSHHTLAG